MILNGPDFLPREDGEIAQAIYESLIKRGITILFDTEVFTVEEQAQQASIRIKVKGEQQKLLAQAVLVATGRTPNTEELHPEKAGVLVGKKGEIIVNKYLQTNVPHIWAMGDVIGGLQFTYISLDDSRIVKSQIMGDGSRHTDNRGAIPYSVFIAPPVSRIGMTEQEARDKGYQVQVGRLLTAAVPKAQVLKNPVGIMKVIIDKKTECILGAHLFSVDSHEMINLIKLAMDAELSYKKLRDMIYTHPTMSEAFNDLFATIS